MLMKSQEAATEQDLFHGTIAVPPEQLYQNEHGFDFRLASRRARWGAGSYFTPCASYSDRYAYRIPGTVNKRVLIAKVLIGVSCLLPEDNTVTKPPPKPGPADTPSPPPAAKQNGRNVMMRRIIVVRTTGDDTPLLGIPGD